MKKISLSFLYPLLALILLTIVLSRQVFIVPPLGVFLNPFVGVVQNEKKSDTNLELQCGRGKSTEILFDERAVPHIFASNQNDLFFAQGYASASDRLWQMDFLSYVSAGRLSEILGKDLLDYDRRQIRSGIPLSAITTLKFIEANPETKSALDNYTEGVNSYINQLAKTDLPLEYKLMDYQPEPWTNLKSVLIMKYMGALLSGYEEDASSSYLLAALGKKEYDKLFSNYLIDETKEQFAINRVKDLLPFNPYIDFSFLESSTQIHKSPFNPRLGSNNWAIGPEKSASGSAILCNDPHLNLSFPAIWYELQLHSNEMNVYGYSIPGTPGVIIGYNQYISWGLTNGSADVRDLFKLELKDDYSQYKYDGLWKNTDQTIVEIKIKNSRSFYDTIFQTIQGLITSDLRFGPKEIQGYATNWTLYDPSNEFLAFIKLNKATNYDEFKEAIKYYKCPAQNFTYADVKGNIATHFQGEIRKSDWSGRGTFILDGTRSAHLSTKILANDELPFVHNPSSGFVFSANNNPFHQANYFGVYGHYTELRANKIEQLLSRDKKFTVEDMKSIQLDNTNRLAELAVPLLLNFVSEDNSKYVKKFREWDYKYNKETEMAFVFERWWTLIKAYTWDELNRFKNVDKRPDDLVLLDLISNDPTNKYFDRLSTDKKETAGDIILSSLEKVTKDFPDPIKWGDSNSVSILHLSHIPAFSRTGIPSSGHPNAINALSGNWGPSLRFIVEMNKIPQGYGVYAGGQSGNPASKKYSQFVDDWSNGKYYKFSFFLTKEEGVSHASYKWTIK